jgi:hypothetical protein
MNSSKPDFNLSFVPSFVRRWFKEVLVRPVNNPFVLSLSKNAFSNHSSFDLAFMSGYSSAGCENI